VAYNAQDNVPQWNRVNAALGNDIALLQACLDKVVHCDGTAMIAWRDMVNGLQTQAESVKLDWVNRFFNRWQYTSDEQAYNQREHWAGPIEFMKNSGDCEDYAIAKYVTLKFLGFNDEAMRIMAVIDNNRGGIGHSVLSVSTVEGKKILDNTTDTVYADNQQTGYAPRFAVNQTGIYTYAQQPQVILASMQ
jgi:predicted transglutaminase-like cysteine proteinase